MKKSVKKFLIIALGAMGVAANQSALADQASCTTAGCTTANLPVTFTIVIPAFLRLQVGAVGSNADVQWTTAVTAANIGTGQVNPDEPGYGHQRWRRCGLGGLCPGEQHQYQ